MALVPLGLVNQVKLAAEVEKAKAKLPPEAVDVSYRLDTDSTGEPAIFFRVILADWATAEERLVDVTSRIAGTLFAEIQPYENWGLCPYVNYGSEAEWRKSGSGRRA